MLEAKYLWQPIAELKGGQVKALAHELSISELLAKLLIERGIKTKTAATAFLKPTVAQIDDPFKLHDLKKAVDRLQQAIAEQERIVVYGDYDVDGITATSVMYEALEQLGAKVNYYVPDRIIDGYGPNLKRYQQLIANQTQLIVTVDNGVAGFKAIEYAQQQGVDVIVTDHHSFGEKMPPAYAIVHPAFPDNNYSCPDLAGVGVAFKVVCGLLQEIPQEMLDLVALGTIADVMKLTGENRALVKFGLQVLQQTQRVGLTALAKRAGVKLSQADEETVAFSFAPRLNSLGRLAKATDGVELLTTFDEQRADELAEKVEELNEQRQKLAEKMTKAALEQLSTQAENLVNLVAAPDWPVGLLGIIASRLVEKTGKPSLVFNLNQSTQLAKGSGRSVAAFDLFKALNPKRDLLTAFGGHQQACGLTLPITKLAQLQKVLNQAADQQGLRTAEREKLQLAAALSVDQVDLSLFDQLKRLKPFGNGNPQPIFAFRDYQLTDARLIGKQKNHLQFKITDGQKKVSAIDFFVGNEGKYLTQDPLAFDFVGHLTLNHWHDQSQVQVIVDDLKAKRPVVCDLRSVKDKKASLKKTGVYFFFKEKHFLKLKKILPKKAQAIVGTQRLDQTLNQNHLVLVDCPDSLAELEKLLKAIQPQLLDLIFLPSIDLRRPLPSRKDLAKVYRFAVSHQQINLKNDLMKLAEYLQINKETLIFTIQLFFEAGFVKIKNGLMTGNLSQKKVDLTQTASYRSRIRQIKTQKILNDSKTADLKKWIIQFLID
ncbi:single-stranded-DNA-specific exonuclease RecJ [Liquorilactobacillus vini]|uniref:Single-stranded-DNA-specific exonuclease RecJ n=2 Tax=Liquorilactobacillus vini TaxID=238015 RepID=A0A0R2CN35_9LACO|nr:single-stranded-DNA-specific exonuclease RecJ [Liquorilactobacillus vini]KRM89251.1 single-stranded-DNA-specific exonuclease [Liquorilactobacillus vini DSM 20605]